MSEMSVELIRGWSWLSLNVEVSESSVNAVCASLQSSLVSNDMVKTQSAFASYYESFGFFGTLTTLAAPRMFKIKVTKPASFRLTGSPVALPHQLTILRGWNYLPNPHHTPTLLAEGLPTGIDFAMNDQIKGQLQFAAFYPGFGWFGSLEKVTPGLGYMLFISGEGGEAVFQPLATSAPTVAPTRGLTRSPTATPAVLSTPTTAHTNTPTSAPTIAPTSTPTSALTSPAPTQACMIKQAEHPNYTTRAQDVALCGNAYAASNIDSACGPGWAVCTLSQWQERFPAGSAPGGTLTSWGGSQSSRMSGTWVADAPASSMTWNSPNGAYNPWNGGKYLKDAFGNILKGSGSCCKWDTSFSLSTSDESGLAVYCCAQQNALG